MNKTKKQEMQDDLIFIRKQFEAINNPVTLPQSLQGEQLRCRLEHTKAVPKATVHQPYWRLVPVACAFVCIVGLSVFMQQMNQKSSALLANDAAVPYECKSEAAPSTESESFWAAAPVSDDTVAAEEAVEEDSDTLPQTGSGYGAPFEFQINQEKEKSSALIEGRSFYGSYDQIESALSKMQKKGKSGVTFGGAGEFEPELHERGEVVEYPDFSLYFGLSPDTEEPEDALYISDDEGEVQEKIILPPQKDANSFLGRKGKNLFVIAAQSDVASIMVMDLPEMKGNGYSQAGTYEKSYLTSEALYVITDLEVGQNDLDSGNYVPYVSTNGNKQYLPAEQIYSVGTSVPQYTVITRFPFDSSNKPSAAAVLGIEATVHFDGETIEVTSQDTGEIAVALDGEDLSVLE